MQITFALADFADIGGSVAVTLCIVWLVFPLEHMFRNVVLEKDGEDQLDRSCKK